MADLVVAMQTEDCCLGNHLAVPLACLELLNLTPASELLVCGSMLILDCSYLELPDMDQLIVLPQPHICLWLVMSDLD